jgi:branched-subunit amino acid aminotransferase/4-amino-4-deoxychorismate lyase
MLLTLAPAPEAAPATPAVLTLSRFVRAEKSAASRYKTMNYLDNILSLAEAQKAGADAGVMLNSRGRVACASAANIFLIGADAVATPSIDEGALPGIVRGLLLKSAPEMRAPVIERAIEVDELRAGALFIANSLIGLRPSRLMDGPAPSAAQTEIFTMLAAWYQRRLIQDLKEKNALP